MPISNNLDYVNDNNLHLIKKVATDVINLVLVKSDGNSICKICDFKELDNYQTAINNIIETKIKDYVQKALNQ